MTKRVTISVNYMIDVDMLYSMAKLKFNECSMEHKKKLGRQEELLDAFFIMGDTPRCKQYYNDMPPDEQECVGHWYHTFVEYNEFLSELPDGMTMTSKLNSTFVL